jgi:hypothetical protein
LPDGTQGSKKPLQVGKGNISGKLLIGKNNAANFSIQLSVKENPEEEEFEEEGRAGLFSTARSLSGEQNERSKAGLRFPGIVATDDDV